jgi:hypothetical protein
MELFSEQNRIEGAFSSDFFTKRYNRMKRRLKLNNEVLTRQIDGFWRLIRFRDEKIREQAAEIKLLKEKLRNFAEIDKASNLF